MKGTTHSSLAIGGATAAVAETALAMAHQGTVGIFAALALGGIAYVVTKDGEETTGKPILPDRPPASAKHPQMSASPALATGQPSLWYRMLNGKSVRGEWQPASSLAAQAKGPSQDDVSFDLNGAETLPELAAHRGATYFSSVLESGFRPTISQIYLARAADGVPLYCHARDLCHVATAGPTGAGKSSIERLLMAQLCAAGVRVLLLNPHYTGYDLEAADPSGKRTPEDWTPFERHLARPPMECRDYGVIGGYLRWAAEKEIPDRLERRARVQPVGQPLFIVLDELPSIIRKVEAAPEYMRVILEEGRKVGIFMISAAHNFLVKTVSPKDGGGSIRDCYRTAYYTGGDPTTAKVLLDMTPNEIPEERLGKGIVMLRSAAIKKAVLAQVPFVDNNALYRLLGPSTYQPKTMMSVPVDLPDIGASQEQEPPSAREQRALPEQMGVPYLRPVPKPAMGMEDMQQGPTRALPERETTGRFTKALPPKLQRAYDAFQDGMSGHKLARILDVTHPTALSYIRELELRGLIDANKRKVVNQ